MWRVEQEHDVIGIFYYTRGWQQQGAAENTSGEPNYWPGWLSRPGDCLKPAGTWVGVSARMYNETQCVTRCKNGEKCEVDAFRCYGTQSRGARNRRNVNSKSSLPERALLLSARLPVNPVAFRVHQKWRGMRNAPFALLWHSATRGRQQEKYSPVSRGCQS